MSTYLLYEAQRHLKSYLKMYSRFQASSEPSRPKRNCPSQHLKTRKTGLTQVNRYFWRVHTMQRQVNRHADTISGHVKWKPRPGLNRQVQSRPLVAIATFCTLSNLSRWSNGKWLWKVINWKILSMDVVEHAKTKWTSAVVLAPKNDGSLRLRVDYRKLNSVTTFDSYPLRRMNECIESLWDAEVISALNANSAYWQLEADPSDRDKTVFTSHYGLLHFLCKQLGLKNAPPHFSLW